MNEPQWDRQFYSPPQLTKRELFAAMAMARLIEAERGIGEEFGFTPAKDVARFACSYADALIAELSKPCAP